MGIVFNKTYQRPGRFETSDYERPAAIFNARTREKPGKGKKEKGRGGGGCGGGGGGGNYHPRPPLAPSPPPPSLLFFPLPSFSFVRAFKMAAGRS